MDLTLTLISILHLILYVIPVLLLNAWTVIFARIVIIIDPRIIIIPQPLHYSSIRIKRIRRKPSKFVKPYEIRNCMTIRTNN